MDRLIWQDVDSNQLTADQVAALRGWLALGGRLIVVGGTAGPGVLSGFPDAILPYRPTTTVDVAAGSLAIAPRARSPRTRRTSRRWAAS